MTNFQFYLLAQAYGSGTYGEATYQCTGSECETQTAQPNVTAPSTGVLRQDNGLTYGIIAIILIVSLVVAGVVVYVKKRIAKKN